MEKPSITAVLEAAGGRVIGGRYGWAKAQCFAHADRNPSASINEDACKFQCFSCGFRGDSFDIIMAWRGLTTFREAQEDAREFGFEFAESAGDERSSSSLRRSTHRRGTTVPSKSRTGRRSGFRPTWRDM